MATSTQQTVKTSFDKKVGAFQVSHEYTQLQLVAAKVTEKTKNENGQQVKIRTFKEINKAKTDTLTARLTSSELGQQLSFGFMRGGSEEDAKDPISRILAVFTMTVDFKMSMVSNHEFNAIDSYIFKPLITAFPGIEAESVSDVFSQWLCTPEFFEHLKIVSSKKGYTPALVKMLVLYISYQDVKDEMGTQTGQVTMKDAVDINEVAKVFQANISALQSSVPKMAKHYSLDLMLAPSKEPPNLEPSQAVENTSLIIAEEPNSPDTTQDDQSVLTLEPTPIVEVPE